MCSERDVIFCDATNVLVPGESHCVVVNPISL